MAQNKFYTEIKCKYLWKPVQLFYICQVAATEGHTRHTTTLASSVNNPHSQDCSQKAFAEHWRAETSECKNIEQ